MQDFQFDIQRFAVANTLKTIANVLTSIAREIVTDGEKIQTAGTFYDFANIAGDLYESAQSINEYIDNNQSDYEFLESLKAFSTALDGIATAMETTAKVLKLPANTYKSLPVFGLAASMPSFTLAIRKAEQEKKEKGFISQDRKDDIATNFIEVVGETVKTLLVLVPIPVVAGADTIFDLTIFPILIDMVTASIKSIYLTNVHDDMDRSLNDTFPAQWLGSPANLISNIVGFFGGKITSAEHSNGLIKIVDDEGNVKYYNETNGIRINLPNDNNRVSNYAYGVTISGGSKNDTIYSKPNSDNSATQGNSIIGDSGKDFIVAYEDNSTIDGGTDDDRIVTLGKNNKICGDNGTDAILLESGANGNTIDGGRGQDYIILEDGVKHAVILYAKGDGNDIIVGYDESDEIRILADYSASIEGQDVIIVVGNDSITLSGATGKEININGTKQTLGSKPTTLPLIITLPSVWHEGFKNLTYTSLDDTIDVYSEKVIINGNGGNDYIQNIYYDNVMINGGAGNDYIENLDANNVTIDGGAGDDYIENGIAYNGKGKNVSINGGAGNDYIENHNVNNVTIDGGADDDSIYNGTFNDLGMSGGNRVSISSGTGDDYIFNDLYGEEVTISSDDGDDTIRSDGSKSILDGGAGNDSIENRGNHVTIVGGTGDDTITNYYRRSNNLFEYTVGDGNDLIEGFNETSTLKIIGANYSSVKSGYDIILTVGKGKITLHNASLLSIVHIDGNSSTVPIALNLTNIKSNTLVTGSEHDDTIDNNGSNVTITGGTGRDGIYNSGANVLIDGGSDTDIIKNQESNVTINGVSGDDHIWNYGNTVKINGGADDDYIINLGNNTTISGDANNDFIYNNGSNVRFKYTSGDGDDLIEGFDETSTLQIGDGKGTYSFAVSDEDAIVTVGDGKITLRGAATLSAVHIDGTGSTVSTDPLRLTNYTSYKKITGTSYNDSIWNEGGSVTINAAAGNDSIVNTGDNSSLNTGDGNDHVSNTMSRYVTINSGSGKDTIYNTALAFTKIDAGADNDSIYSFSDYTTINGGTGNDTVSLNTSGGHNVIEYVSGDGNDIIYDLGSTDTLKITNGAWFSVANGDDVLVNVDSGTITLNGAKGKTVNIDGKKLTSIIVDDYETIEVEDLLSHLTNATLYGSNINNSKNTALITGTDYNDTIKNAGNTIFVRAGAGQDSIYNTGYALIEAGTGSDTVTNYGNYSTILGGDGNDSIYNRANGVFIYSDAGKDNIYFSGQSSYILSGADNDSIYVTGSGNRVYAGEGNDTISITSSATAITIEGGRGDDVIIGKGLAQTFLYASGDGNDLIQDFKINSTLQIGDGKGTYSTVKSGSDIIVIVGDGQVTLQGATKLSKLNIAGIYENSLNINGTNSSESIINSLTGATIHTFSGNDTINNWGANVLIDSGADNDLIQNYYNSNVIIQGKDGNDSILNFYSNNVTLDGGEGDDSIQSDYSSNIFINCSDGKDTVDNWSSFITIDSGAGNDFIENHHSNVTINGGADNDTVFNDGGYNHIFINTGAGNDSVLNYSRLVTIDGGDGYDTIKNYYSELVTIIGNRGNDYIDNNAQNVLFNYKAGDGNDFIRGFNETSTLQISDGNGTYSSQKSGSDVLVSVGSSVITLEGASTLSIVNINGTEGNYWNLNDATAKYGNSSKTLVTVKGIKSLDGISLSGTTVTVKVSSLNKTNVTISDGYTLKLSDVNPPTPTPAHFDDLTYKSESNSEGYSLSSDKKIISYSPTVAETDLFTLTNVKNTGSIAVNRTDKTVTLKANNLTSKNVTITGNAYTLALGSDVPTSAKQTAGSFTSFSNGTAKFKSNSFSAFYTLSSKKISYTAASGGKEITIAGLKKSLKLKNSAIAGITPTYSNGVTTFKIKADDLTTGNVTLTGEGKLQLDGYTKPKTVAASFVGGVYTLAYTPAFYTATDKKITYTTRVGGDKFSIIGLKSSANPTKSNTGIKVDSKGVVTISATALDGKSVTLVNDTADDVNKITYKLAIDSSVSTKATTTNASWTKKNSSFTYTAPITSAFYTLKGNKLNYTAKTGGSQFTVTGLKNTSAVTVSGKKVTIGNASLNGKAVTLTGDYTLALAKDVPTSAKKTAGNFSVVSKGTATYKTTTFGGYYKISSKKTSFITATGGQAITIKNLNTSANLSTVKKGITVAEQSNGTYKITFKNSGVLTTKAPTVSVAKGLKYTVAVADSLKPVTKVATWNVSGTTAVFRFDTTAGYTVKNNAVVYSAKKNGSPLMELTNLAKGVKASSITTKGKIVTLNSSVLGAKTSVKSNNGSYSINLTGNMSKKKFIGTSKADTLIVAANNASIDSGAGNDVVTVSSLKVTINGGTGNDKLSGGKNVDWIYGGANNDSILGNAGNDHLFGEAGNDSLRGGAGADTLTSGKGDDHLWGDAGKDTFIYASGDGKDVIHGFENGDLLQITGTFNASYNKSKKEIYFKVGSTASAITLKDFTATSFNINGDSYKISGTKLVKR